MAAEPGELIWGGREQIGIFGSQQPGTKEMEKSGGPSAHVEEGIRKGGSARGGGARSSHENLIKLPTEMSPIVARCLNVDYFSV